MHGRLAWQWLAALALMTGVAPAAQIRIGDTAVIIDEPLSAFEDGDRIVAGPAGAIQSIRDFLELRARREFVEPTRLTVERRGARIGVEIPASAHWGLHPPVALESRVIRTRAPDPLLTTLSAEERGHAALWRWDGVGAELAWREAIELREHADDSAITTWKARLGLGEAALLRRDLAAADAHFAAVDTALARGWPRAPLRFRALVHRVTICIEKRDFAGAESRLADVDALARTVKPPVLAETEWLRVSGRYQFFRDNFPAALERYEKSLELARSVVPGSAVDALVDANVGVVLWRQGDLAAAERRYSQALEIVQREAPGTVLVAGILMNLGTVHHLRRDFAAAERNYRRALDIFEATSKTSPETLRALTNLALALGLGGKPRDAIATLERVLAAQLETNPGSLDTAYTWNALGLNYGRTGDWARAETNYSRAIAIREERGLLGVGLANTLTSRGDARITLGDAAGARTDLTRALAIFDVLAPGSQARAECLHRLGTLSRQQGDVPGAMEFFRRAIDVLDRQQSHLGGSDEARSSWSAFYSSYYKDYVELLLRERRAPEAFETLERYRGRVLRAALAGGVTDAMLPAELRGERDTLRASIETSLRKLQSIEKPAEESARVSALLKELEDLRTRQDALGARIRELAPRVAELDQVQAANVSQVRASMTRDSALVSYAVLPDAVQIFVVTPGNGGRVFTARTELPAAELRERVDRLAFLLSTPSEASDARAALDRGAHDLYRLLVAPVASQLGRYPRWIVVPDGALHRLPFGALIERPAAEKGGRPRYVVESHVLTTVVSATVFGQMQRREADRTWRRGIAAFGDPQLSANARLTTSTARGDGLRDELSRPLPWARQEVEEIGRLIGPGAEVYVGTAATEARVREAALRAPALHFASHGVLDEQSPLDSFLLLAGPIAGAGRDNDGRLSAREVFDLPPLAAALVTLSACSTSASADNDGEGLLGLTRAFQANGATAVVSSLWKVSDRSTAELMLEFYRHWPAVSVDEALAKAQRKYVSRHPFYWAAFEVSGARGAR